MKKLYFIIIFLYIHSIFFTCITHAQSIDEIKINPLQLVTYKEVRNITDKLGNELFPGYDFSKIPALFYRPKVQELLINYPHQPKGFSIYKGFNPLSNEPVYARNDSTMFQIDDQNTSRNLEGIDVLIVADYFSRMRNKIRDISMNRDKDFISQWLNDWNFVPSSYDEIRTMLHEGFHVYQTQKAPDKFANESLVANYPLLDPENNTLCTLEGKILHDALLTESESVRLEKIKEFVAVRTYRHSLLKKEMTDYENLNEYVEGLAKYIEYKFLRTGEKLTPVKEMYLQNGFNGYKGVLSAQFKNEMENMVKIISLSDDRFSNKFGTGPMRLRLYYSGACIALLLDYVMPEWKTQIFNNGIYLGELLKNSVGLKENEIKNYLEKAKTDYSYNQIFADKKDFENEGKSKIQEKLDAIIKTKNTLITVSYSNYPVIKGMNYTPFGVTQVNENSAIYDLVPITLYFEKTKKLTLKKVIPVLVDRDKKEITFETKTLASDIGVTETTGIDNEEFAISNMGFEIKKEDNHVTILLK